MKTENRKTENEKTEKPKTEKPKTRELGKILISSFRGKFLLRANFSEIENFFETTGRAEKFPIRRNEDEDEDEILFPDSLALEFSRFAATYAGLSLS